MDKRQHSYEGTPFKEFMTAIGTIAETALVFYRSALEAGGTQEEAMRLTQALISAALFSGGKKENPND